MAGSQTMISKPSLSASRCLFNKTMFPERLSPVYLFCNWFLICCIPKFLCMICVFCWCSSSYSWVGLCPAQACCEPEKCIAIRSKMCPERWWRGPYKFNGSSWAVDGIVVPPKCIIINIWSQIKHKIRTRSSLWKLCQVGDKFLKTWFPCHSRTGNRRCEPSKQGKRDQKGT